MQPIRLTFYQSCGGSVPANSVRCATSTRCDQNRSVALAQSLELKNFVGLLENKLEKTWNRFYEFNLRLRGGLPRWILRIQRNGILGVHLILLNHLSLSDGKGLAV